MPKRSAKQLSLVASTSAEPKVWLRADYEFPSTFSYRVPGASSQFAVGSPVPSPTAVKLALVDAAIRWSGSVDEGKRIFNMVKTARVIVIPPRRVARFRAFVKRLKPRGGELLESTGVRDYFLLDGPLSVFIEIPGSALGEIRDLLYKIRRLGTTDSLCWCSGVREEEPPEGLCPAITSHSQDDHGKPAGQFPAGFPVRLTDLTSASDFDSFNPFMGRGKDHHLCQEVHVLPLRLVRSGEVWAIFERVEG